MTTRFKVTGILDSQEIYREFDTHEGAIGYCDGIIFAMDTFRITVDKLSIVITDISQ